MRSTYIIRDSGTNVECFNDMQVLENNGGAERDRTVDLLNAIQALSQLSYSPTGISVLIK